MKSLNRKTKEGKKRKQGFRRKKNIEIYSRMEKEDNKTSKVEYIFLQYTVCITKT